MCLKAGPQCSVDSGIMAVLQKDQSTLCYLYMYEK